MIHNGFVPFLTGILFHPGVHSGFVPGPNGCGGAKTPFKVVDKLNPNEEIQPCTLVKDGASFSQMYLEEKRNTVPGM